MITNKTHTILQKHLILNRHSRYQNTPRNHKKKLTMFNFHHSQITQKEFEQPAQLLLKYPMVCATSKSDVGKVNSTLHLPLKPDKIFKKQRVSKVPIH